MSEQGGGRKRKGERRMINILSQLSVQVRKPIIRLVNKPTPVTYIGPGSVKKMGAIITMMDVKRVLVVTDRMLHDLGLLDGMLESIESAGIDMVLFDGVQTDPSFSIIDTAAEYYVGCDAIVAVGGGSVLDTAKAVGAAVANGKPAAKLTGLLKVKRRLPPYIAVPTTAGTGSETTVAAVISDPDTHRKKQILDPKLVPAIAVLDPELTVGLPPQITVYTVIDALTHAIEAYVSGYADKETDRYARIAVKLIYENLPQVRSTPGNLAAREALLSASFFGGMAFTRTYVGYVHAFAHTIGGKFGIPHGLANAVLLPHVMQYYLPVCTGRFAELARLTGVCEETDTIEQQASKFVQSLFAFQDKYNIPSRFETFPASAIEEVISVAFKECHGTYPVPLYYSRSSARELMEKVCSPDNTM